jgi:hypothetical protein
MMTMLLCYEVSHARDISTRPNGKTKEKPREKKKCLQKKQMPITYAPSQIPGPETPLKQSENPRKKTKNHF